MDLFTVKNELEIKLELGTWDKSNGLKLEMSIYRWDRRTDMNGAKLIHVIRRGDTKSGNIESDGTINNFDFE